MTVSAKRVGVKRVLSRGVATLALMMTLDAAPVMAMGRAQAVPAKPSVPTAASAIATAAPLAEPACTRNSPPSGLPLLA